MLKLVPLNRENKQKVKKMIQWWNKATDLHAIASSHATQTIAANAFANEAKQLQLNVHSKDSPKQLIDFSIRL